MSARDHVQVICRKGRCRPQAGSTWTRYVNEEQTRRSLVRTGDGVTYIVTGTGPWAEIEGFTATLRAG